MYGYERRESKLKKFFATFFLMILVSISSIYFYKMYAGININESSGNNRK